MAQPQVPLLDQLVRHQSELGQVIADLQLGPRSQRAHEAIVDRVEQLAAEMRSAVRGAARRPSAAPIWTDGAGQAVW